MTKKLDRWQLREIEEFESIIEEYKKMVNELKIEAHDLSSTLSWQFSSIISEVKGHNGNVDIHEVVDVDEVKDYLKDLLPLNKEVARIEKIIRDLEGSIEEIKNREVFKKGKTFEGYKTYLKAAIHITTDKTKLQEYKDEYDLYYGI